MAAIQCEEWLKERIDRNSESFDGYMMDDIFSVYKAVSITYLQQKQTWISCRQSGPIRVGISSGWPQQRCYYQLRIMRPQAATRLLEISRHFVFSTAKRTSYRFQFGSHMIPHPAKAHKGGEDAMFASDNVLVVADGVGGWADHGVDPGLYSKRLCAIIGEKVKKNLEIYIDDPAKLLAEAVKQNKEVGSTTVIMFHLNKDTGALKIYYLGDSVFAAFGAEGAKVAPDQQKSFNFPYQVGSEGDDPSEGILYDLNADSFLNDMFVIASDGLWDNYPIGEMYHDVKDFGESKDYNTLAKTIATRSYKCSLQQDYQSPFYLKAKEQGIRYYKEGKPDDITVITAKIVKEQL